MNLCRSSALIRKQGIKREPRDTCTKYFLNLLTINTYLLIQIRIITNILKNTIYTDKKKPYRILHLTENYCLYPPYLKSSELVSRLTEFNAALCSTRTKEIK